MHNISILVEYRDKLLGVESDDVIQRLHHNLARGQLNSLGVDERLVRYIVEIVETVHLLHRAVLDAYTRYAIAGTSPDVVHVILNHRMDDAVEETVTAREDDRGGLGRHVEVQAVGRSHPCPLAAVDEHHIRLLALELIDTSKVVHHFFILQGQLASPRQYPELGIQWAVIQYAAHLRT